MLGGLLVGLAIGLPHLVLPTTWSISFASLTLVFIAGIYVGFAIIHGREQAFLTEVTTAIAFSAFALVGLFFSAWLIPIALVGHAIWDLLHHQKSRMLSEVPMWYIPFCIVIDLVLALILALGWSGFVYPIFAV